jgi:putative transposase
MPRQSRVDVAGEVYHVINRANARAQIFKTPNDYQAVMQVLQETLETIPLDIFSFCLMPNHWHFAIRPRNDGDMGKFFGKLTQTITQRWHAFHHTSGMGHLFQGRYKAFLVQTDAYFIQLMKYIEANPLRAGLVVKSEDWGWGSLNIRMTNPELCKILFASWPVDMPPNYPQIVNEPTPKEFLEQLRNSVVRGKPLGGGEWLEKMVREYGLESTIRHRGGQRRGQVPSF